MLYRTGLEQRAMKAIVQTGPEAVELQDRDRPSPGPEEALIRVHTAGLCGSDAHAYRYEQGYEWVPLPRVMGHEYAGEVVEIGADVSRVAVGDGVVEEPIRSCGDCFQCNNGQSNVCQEFSIAGMHTDGAYTEFRAAPAENLHVVPEDVPLHHAAITEPLSVAVRAVFDRSETTPGDDVLVEGPGPIGVLLAIVADSMGADVVVSGVSQDRAYRLPLVADLGIDSVDVDTRDLADVTSDRTGGRGFDVIFDATGHHTGIETAVDHVRKGGQIVVVGLPGSESELFMTPLVRGEVDLTTSYASLWHNFEKALQLMAQGLLPIDDILDESYSVEDPTAAFEAFLGSESCKPVFDFSNLR